MSGEEFRRLRELWGMKSEDLGETLGIPLESVLDFEQRATHIPPTVAKHMRSMQLLRYLEHTLRVWRGVLCAAGLHIWSCVAEHTPFLDIFFDLY